MKRTMMTLIAAASLSVASMVVPVLTPQAGASYLQHTDLCVQHGAICLHANVNTSGSPSWHAYGVNQNCTGSPWWFYSFYPGSPHCRVIKGSGNVLSVSAGADMHVWFSGGNTFINGYFCWSHGKWWAQDGAC